MGIDTITMGNHPFEKKELVQKIDTDDRLVNRLKESCPAIIVDFHAEATSDKAGMGYFLGGSSRKCRKNSSRPITAADCSTR